MNVLQDNQTHTANAVIQISEGLYVGYRQEMGIAVLYFKKIFPQVGSANNEEK